MLIDYGSLKKNSEIAKTLQFCRSLKQPDMEFADNKLTIISQFHQKYLNLSNSVNNFAQTCLLSNLSINSYLFASSNLSQIMWFSCGVFTLILKIWHGFLNEKQNTKYFHRKISKTNIVFYS